MPQEADAVIPSAAETVTCADAEERLRVFDVERTGEEIVVEFNIIGGAVDRFTEEFDLVAESPGCAALQLPGELAFAVVDDAAAWGLVGDLDIGIAKAGADIGADRSGGVDVVIEVGEDTVLLNVAAAIGNDGANGCAQLRGRTCEHRSVDAVDHGAGDVHAAMGVDIGLGLADLDAGAQGVAIIGADFAGEGVAIVEFGLPAKGGAGGDSCAERDDRGAVAGGEGAAGAGVGAVILQEVSDRGGGIPILRSGWGGEGRRHHAEKCDRRAEFHMFLLSVLKGPAAVEEVCCAFPKQALE